MGVDSSQVAAITDHMGCTSGSLTFMHLGIPVGENMSWVIAWSSIIDRFRSRLGGWKAKTLYFSHRLTLIKSVLGSISSYLMSVFPTLVTVLSFLES